MSSSDVDLRLAAETLCDQLCEVAAGNLEVRLNVDTGDLTAQKLSMLANGVLHVARLALSEAEQKGRELTAAQEMAKLGTYRVETNAGLQSWSFSPELCRLLGIAQGAVEPCLETWLNLVHFADRDRVKAAHDNALRGRSEAYEFRVVCPDGADRYIWTELRSIDVGHSVIGLRAVCQDVTERRRSEERIRYLAEHDALTGLVNRTVLREHLTTCLGHRVRARGKPASLAVMYIDLDGFKLVNDQHGHAAGDAILVEAARRMRATIRKGDLVARLGGDEFAIVQVSHDHPGASDKLARRLLSSLSRPYKLAEGLQIASVSASIGMAFLPGDASHLDGLLAAADSALYRAKRAGRNRIALFRPEMEKERRERRSIEEDLRRAIDKDELSVVYQPLAGTQDKKVLGYEALLRWSHPVRGMVPPDVFIPLAEDRGTILQIGEWVLERACAEAASWEDPLFVAVNVSPVQIQRGGDFAAIVEKVLARTGLQPCRLELEVTEGVLIRDADAALKALGRLRDLGVRIALDDFGTGYSSLATLQAFPFDKIKVDRRFVAGFGGGSPQDAAIVRAVLGLARGLGLPVVAEGVETIDQYEALRLEGCAEVQGWFIGRPGPIPGPIRKTPFLAA